MSDSDDGLVGNHQSLQQVKTLTFQFNKSLIIGYHNNVFQRHNNNVKISL